MGAAIKSLRRDVDALLGRVWAAMKEIERPDEGWIWLVRTALGMTRAQFAERLGVSRGVARRLEQSEAADSIKLCTLRRAAKALGCRVFYVLVPDETGTLGEIVERRRRDLTAGKFRLDTFGDRLKRGDFETLHALFGARLRAGRIWDAGLMES